MDSVTRDIADQCSMWTSLLQIVRDKVCDCLGKQSLPYCTGHFALTI